MANITFKQFYQKFGVRSLSLLSNPKIFNIDNFILPRNSIVHYIPENAIDMGPSTDYFVFKNERIRPYADNITVLEGNYGNPRRRGSMNLESLAKRWFTKHRQFRRTPDILKALTDKNIAIMANYAFAPLPFRYLPVPLARYYRFQNMMATVYKRAAFYAEKSTRQQFIFVKLPEVLPSRQHLNISVEDFHNQSEVREWFREKHLNGQPTKTFKEVFDLYYPGFSEDFSPDLQVESFDEAPTGMGEPISFDQGTVALEEMNRIRLGYFSNDQALILQDLWQWLTLHREESLLSKIPDNHIEKINFVFLRNGKFTLLNMGLLAKWTRSEENTKGDSFQSISVKLNNHLKAVMAVSSVIDKAYIEETVADDENESVVVGVNDPNDLDVTQTMNNDPLAIAGIDEVPGDPDAPDADSAIEEPDAKSEITPPRVGIKDQVISIASKVRGNQPTSIRFSENQTNEEPVIDIPSEEEGPVDPLVIGVEKSAERLLNKGLISVSEFNRHVRLANRYKEIPAPLGNEGTLENFKVIPHATVWDFHPTKIPDIPHVKDKSMLKSTLIDYDKKYVKEVMQKDVLNMILNFQKRGLAITDYKVERITDAMGDLYDYTIKISPVYGTPSTIRFQLPVVDDNGKYRVNGVKYYMRKLRFDKPIRKISDDTVALSTYYGKVFVGRSQRASDDLDLFYYNGIDQGGMLSPPTVTNIVYGNTFADEQPVPRIYSSISKNFVSFTAKTINFVFDYKNIEKFFPELNWTQIKTRETLPVGRLDGKVVYLNKSGDLLIEGKVFNKLNTLLELNEKKEPIESVNIGILGQDFPLAIILFYISGLWNTIQYMEIKPERRSKGSRVNDDPNTFDIFFADEIWRIPRIQHRDVLIYASLLQWKDVLRNYSIAELDDPDTYGTILGEKGLSGRYLYECRNLESLFIDPISEEVLKDMDEPTEFIPLLFKAAFYLTTDEYPSDLSAEHALFKGYERMAGAVYRGIVDSVRRFSNQPMGSKSIVDIAPYQILANIQSDPSVSLVEDSNPIHNLKEKENVTYSGTGGRSKRSMVRRTRAFHKSDMGIRAEAGVDNGDVGINCFLTANPNLTSLRGTARTETDVNPEKNGIGNLLSTSALISPFATYDDQNLHSLKLVYLVSFLI